MNSKFLLALMLSLILLTACSRADVTDEPTTGYPIASETQEPTTAYPVASQTPELDLESTAEQVINALAEKDMAKVVEFVHPEMGVRFSPYGFVREEHQVFMPDSLAGLFESDTVYTWGTYDGIGGPIELTFEEYYEEFVYSVDFANPEEIEIDERLGQGNSINNIHDFYPSSSFVEYHFSGFEEAYEGMDWESLRLVFVQEDGVWCLVGILHDEWTI